VNLLLDSVPTSVVIDGVRHDVDTDFRVFIQIEKILHDESLSNREKVLKWLQLVFGQIPTNIQAAVDRVMWLYRCGADPDEKSSTGRKAKETLLYDFEFDAPYIYAAFLAQYGIDLTEEDLHWWKFIALFRALTGDSKIVEIMSYRAADPSEIKDEKERARILKLKRIYAIPVTMTLEQKVAQAGAVFGGGLF